MRWGVFLKNISKSMKTVILLRMKLLLFPVILFLSIQARSQCTWGTYFYDSFEYSTVIPYIVPGTTYQNTPQNFGGCVHSGTKGLYLNFADGVSGLIYDQPFTNLCIGQSYRFSLWAQDAWGGTNNMTFRVLNTANVVISTQTVITNGFWQQVILPAFTATGDIRFQIITNTPGGPGNDAGIDDLELSICNPNPTNYTVTQCSTVGTLNLYPQITSGLSTNGIWTGPSALTNGYNGTFTAGTNTNGTYTYTVDGVGTCPDSTATVQVTLITSPNINPLGPISACSSYTLPAITGTSLSGNQHYYTGPNGTGTMIPTGTVITSSQTIYMYDGASGCSDNETVNITISSPGNAGTDNGASYCGPGPTINLTNFLSAGATAGGIWTETSVSPSGGLSGTNWNTAGINQGTYTFTYTVAANGACPADVANFTMLIGNIPNVNLGNDTTLCAWQTLLLNAGNYDTYLWDNGTTTPTKLVSNPGGTFWVKVGTLGSNQIVNGDFESGNIGFTTQYLPGTGGSWGVLSNQGTYAVTTSPNLVHNNFNSCSDHTPNPGSNQLVVNGASTPNTSVWCQTIPVQPNTTYQFGTWATSVENGQPVGQLQFTINSLQLGSVFSPSINGCSWSQFTQIWQSGMTTSAQICIVNQNTNGGGNDFALDDITFRPICYSTDTITVNFNQQPVVNLGPDQNHCAGTTVTLDAQNPGMTYVWNTGDTTQTLDVISSGNLSVTVTNANGCTGTDSINVNFETQLYAGNDSSDYTCSTTTQFDLTDLVQVAAASGGTWESLTPAYSGTLSANGTLGLSGQSGSFDFQYIVQGTYCPNDTATFNLIVHQQPVAAADQSLHFCNTVGSSVDFSGYLNHPFDPIAGYWETAANVPGGSFNSTSNVFDLTNVPADLYTFYMILPSDPGCVQDTTEIEVKVTAVPVVNFSSDVIEGCQPLNVLFTNASVASGNTVYTWNLGDGTTSASSTDVQNTYEAVGCYDITLTVTSDGLCTSSQTLNDMICVHAVPFAAFDYGPQQVYSDGPEVHFTNESDNYDFSDWDFGDGGASSQDNPTHTFPIGDVGNYTVQLIVTTTFGCSDTTTRIVVVKDQLILYVPNSFTPDNDEFNPVFIPVMTAGIDENDYGLDIYDRWGELVFSTTDIHEGWDGTYRGVPVKEGTYTWKLHFGLMENDGKETAIGHVTVLR